MTPVDKENRDDFLYGDVGLQRKKTTYLCPLTSVKWWHNMFMDEISPLPMQETRGWFCKRAIVLNQPVNND